MAKKIGKRVVDVIAALSIVFLLWLLISFIDVNLHNNPLKGDCGQLLSWNAFSLITEGSDVK